jgi:hypothetical protein
MTAAALVLGAISIGTVVAIREPAPRAFAFKPVTFRRGHVSGAAFAPDGRSVLYTAAWDNGPRRLFLTSPLSPESRALALDGYGLVSVSSLGELALLEADGTLPIAGGSLARVPMNGGAPKAFERNVMSADWAPDGQLAVARMIDGTTRLELPSGSVRHQTAGWISGVRVSPQGDFIAFLEHPLRHDNRGTLKLMPTAVEASDRLGLQIVGGPTWLRLDYPVVTGVRFSETFPFNTANFTGADTARGDAWGTGLMVGGDLMWRWRQRVGIGVGPAFRHVSVDVTAAPERRVTVDAGRLRAHAGVRLVF